MNIVVRCIPVKWSVVVNTTNEKRYNVEAKRPDIELNFFFRIRNKNMLVIMLAIIGRSFSRIIFDPNMLKKRAIIPI